jgi:hypothetical protein
MCIDCDLLELDMQGKRADTIEKLTNSADRLDDMGEIELRDQVLLLIAEALPKAETEGPSQGEADTADTAPKVSDENEKLMRQATEIIAKVLGVDPSSLVLVSR